MFIWNKRFSRSGNTDQFEILILTLIVKLRNMLYGVQDKKQHFFLLLPLHASCTFVKLVPGLLQIACSIIGVQFIGILG